MNRADQWARDGLTALQNGRLADAESNFRRYLAAVPNHPQVLHWLGLTLLHGHQYTEAIAAIGDAGRLLGWPLEMRYNYCVALGSSLPLYMPTALIQRINRLTDHRKQTRVERENQPANFRLLLLYAGARAPGLIGLEQGDAGGHSSDSLEILCERFDWAVAADDPMSVASVLQRHVVDYVCIADGRTQMDHSQLRAMCRALWLNDAKWGFARVELAQGAGPRADFPPELTTALVRHATRAVCDSATKECFANPLLPVQVSNIVADARTFAGIQWSGLSRANVLPHLVTSFATQSEPLFMSQMIVTIDEAQVAELRQNIDAARRASGLALEKMFRAFLQGEVGPNPLAPDPQLHPVAGIRHFLRYGSGAYIGPELLEEVAKRVTETNALPLPVPVRDGGVDVVGFTRAETGLGENLRSVVRVAQQAGVPVSAVELEFELGVRRMDRSVDAVLVDAPARAVRIYALNPDLLGQVLMPCRRDGKYDHYRVGCWAWELERLPASWKAATEWMDEIWGISDFVRDSIARATNKPVFTLSSSIQPPAPSRVYRREEFGIPQDAVVFLYSFAYESYVSRKNPWATIRAFRRAFPLHVRDACLVVKTSASARFVDMARALREEAAGDPRILFIDAILTRDEVAGLQHCCDVYVSLHRSEGFGFGIAECMSIGKLAIATAYSANLDFMKSDNSLLVDYDLVPVGAGNYVDTDGQLWAEARLDDAADKMRAAYESRSMRDDMGRRAASFIEAHFSPQAVGAVFRGHIERIHRGL
jgi:glycosyltransferase involved in cell wall biosynthesis